MGNNYTGYSVYYQTSQKKRYGLMSFSFNVFLIEHFYASHYSNI